MTCRLCGHIHEVCDYCYSDGSGCGYVYTCRKCGCEGEQT